MNVCTCTRRIGGIEKRGGLSERPKRGSSEMKLTMVGGELGGECGKKERNKGEDSQLHLRVLLVLVLVLVLVLMLVLMLLMLMFGTHSFGIAAGRRHHSHGDAVGVSVSVSRRIAVIHLRDCSASGVSKLHRSRDGTL
jgi:hypothetical protein